MTVATTVGDLEVETLRRIATFLVDAIESGDEERMRKEALRAKKVLSICVKEGAE